MQAPASVEGGVYGPLARRAVGARGPYTPPSTDAGACMDLTVRPLTPELWPALEDLFGRAGASNGCWCMYWRLGPRYHERPRPDNKRDLRALAASGRPSGLVAFDGDLAVGWCQLAPRADLAWLAQARHLGPVDDLPVWSIPCFFVRRSHRRRGVTTALLDAATDVARRAGAPALEAYP